MSVTLTSSWQTVATAQVSYYYDYNYTWTIALQAKYSNQSGNSAHVKARAIITNNGAYPWYGTNKGYNIQNQGYVQYTATVNGGANFTTNEYDLGSMTGGGSKSISGVWSVMGSYNATASETVVMPQFIIAPSTPVVAAVTNDAHKNTITWSLTSFGYPASGNVKLWYSTSPSFTSETLLSTKTSTGQWTYNHTGLTANTTYYYRAKADNGSATSSYGTASVTTRRAVYAPSATNKTKLVKNLLVPFNGLSKNVIKLYRGDSNNEAERIY